MGEWAVLGTMLLSITTHAVLLVRGLRTRAWVGQSGGWGYSIVVSPIVEEILYRGLPWILWTWGNPIVAAALAGVGNTLWVTGHRNESWAFFYRMVLAWGYMLAALATGTILTAMLLHAANNAIGLTVEEVLRRRQGLAADTEGDSIP